MTSGAWNLAEGVALREDGPVDDELKGSIKSASPVEKEIGRTMTRCMNPDYVCQRSWNHAALEEVQLLRMVSDGPVDGPKDRRIFTAHEVNDKFVSQWATPADGFIARPSTFEGVPMPSNGMPSSLIGSALPRG